MSSFSPISFDSGAFDDSFDIESSGTGSSYRSYHFAANHTQAYHFGPSGDAVSETYRPDYFSAFYTQANYFTPSLGTIPDPEPSVSVGPLMRGLIPGRLPGFNSGLIF